LGMAVVGGMLVSTALTLIVVPVFYSLLARFAGDPARSRIEAFATGEADRGAGAQAPPATGTPMTEPA